MRAPSFILTTTILVQGCVLVGLEPDEIDVADESEDGEATGDEAESDSMTSATGAEDPTGDGDPGGDGDGDTEGDTGDGDPTTTGDGDGDGDPTGDTDAPLPCDDWAPIPLVLGENDVTIADGVSEFDASCGAAGPEQIYSFTVDIDTNVSFTLQNPTFEGGVLVLVDTVCEPLAEVQCIPNPGPLTEELLGGIDYYLIVDTDAGGGSATLLVEFL